MLDSPFILRTGWVFSTFCIRNDEDMDEEEDLFKRLALAALTPRVGWWWDVAWLGLLFDDADWTEEGDGALVLVELELDGPISRVWFPSFGLRPQFLILELVVPTQRLSCSCPKSSWNHKNPPLISSSQELLRQFTYAQHGRLFFANKNRLVRIPKVSHVHAAIFTTWVNFRERLICQERPNTVRMHFYRWYAPLLGNWPQSYRMVRTCRQTLGAIFIKQNGSDVVRVSFELHRFAACTRIPESHAVLGRSAGQQSTLTYHGKAVNGVFVLVYDWNRNSEMSNRGLDHPPQERLSYLWCLLGWWRHLWAHPKCRCFYRSLHWPAFAYLLHTKDIWRSPCKS